MSDASFTPLPPESFRRTPWKNGGGVTIDIADAYREGATPGSWEGMIWRFGRTSIVAPGPFSDLTGYERLQLVIAGSGLVLETPAGEIDLRRPFKPVRYDGGTPIISRLENGPVEVVNLIADRALCKIDLIVVTTGQDAMLGAGRHVIYAPENAFTGSCDAKPVRIEPGQALLIEARIAVSLKAVTGLAVLATIAQRPSSA
ncbi:environmental stress-induced protein Ves [Bosea sp. BE125]|uniref:HutD/Ves family protein n=1 Tax=Bosea sp. BE125 TaxID=2817909 RepID=UPI0028585BB9|nr:HutD family protein [Bosea sp. BE125]MDR6874668.1 environmental stress-induced protein Ves [Bosea sp. BE125]